MKLFREKFSPNLIDLVKYEKDLLYQARHGITLMPPPTIPRRITGWGEGWSDSEMQAMRDNRSMAEQLYQRIKEESRKCACHSS